MKSLYLSLITLFCFTACAQKTVTQPKITEVKLYYPNGKLKISGYEIDGMKTGTSKTYYENGVQKTENHWENNLQTGTTTKWFSNGKIEWKGQIVNGEEAGEWKYFDDLNGAYIYSAVYKNGEVDSFWFTNDKYNWRKINFKAQHFEVDFPSFITDSLASENGQSFYWAMFPWAKKKDIEYFYVITLRSIIKEDSFFKMIYSVPELELLKSIVQSEGNSEYDNSIPDPRVDRYSLVSKKQILINGKKCLELVVEFNDLNLKSRSILFIQNGNLCIVGAYENETIDKSIIDRFLKSVVTY